jgi:hypothetical protein
VHSTGHSFSFLVRYDPYWGASSEPVKPFLVRIRSIAPKNSLYRRLNCDILLIQVKIIHLHTYVYCDYSISDLSSDLEDVADQDAFVLLVKHTKPRKSSSELPETLAEIRFRGELQKYTLRLNRNTNTGTSKKTMIILTLLMIFSC